MKPEWFFRPNSYGRHPRLYHSRCKGRPSYPPQVCWRYLGKGSERGDYLKESDPHCSECLKVAPKHMVVAWDLLRMEERS